MISTGTLALLVLSILASFFTAWTIGAGSSGATPFAPAVGANALPTLRAAFVVGILGFLGAVLQGANVTETVGKNLIEGVTLGPLAATIALTAAATMIAIGVFTGYPIATAFAVSGAVVGVGLAAGGDPAVAEYIEIAAFWVLTPVIAVPVAYVTARTLRDGGISEARVIVGLAGIVGVVVANMGFTVLGAPSEAVSVATVGARRLGELPPAVGRGLLTAVVALGCAALARGAAMRDLDRAKRRFLLLLGGLVAFSAGGGKVGLAIGPLLPLFDTAIGYVPLFPLLIFGGLGLLAGSWMASSRMIKALTQDYSTLGPRRSIAALVPSFIIAQAGIVLGVPMSFNEIFISAIAGSGLAAGRGEVSGGKLGYTALAWIGSLVGGAVASYGGYALVMTAV